MTLDDEYVELLRFTNGFSNNGVSIAGVAVASGTQHRDDFLSLNQEFSWRENPRDTIYGTSDGDLFIRSASDAKFRLVSGVGSWDACYKPYDSFIDLVVEDLRSRLSG